MAYASNDLQWLLLRKHTSFIVKRDGALFTSEPNNLTQKNTYKYSGLANAGVVGIETDSNGHVVVTRRKAKAGRKISGGNAALRIQKTGDFRRVARNVKSNARASRRPDLNQAALARWTRISQSIKNAKKAEASSTDMVVTE
eukprot:CAMPEP_0119132068 /NCGR_PEP_ID=MMETSP1310-20130426/11330_1 /TAXON_ID=464262 /ORGANISM="Genus nov. species nov., Strain RCC2339" /LENGTH=141 /DNA_ID=CAMNT_0007122679 /DNA_START=75 /DNA_END=500 /DNA_ORIENTATION=+